MARVNQQDPYSIIRRIMREEMEMNWTCNVPQGEQHVTPAASVEVIQNSQDNSDIQYVSQLTAELKNKLDAIYQLVANTEEAYALQTRDIIRTLIEISNLIDQPLDQLNLLNNLQNTAAQTTTAVIL